MNASHHPVVMEDLVNLHLVVTYAHVLLVTLVCIHVLVLNGFIESKQGLREGAG